MFKVNNKGTRTTPIKWSNTLKQFVGKFTPYSRVSIVNFEQVNAGWVSS